MSTPIIKDYTGTKVAEYLRMRHFRRVLIRFHHGLGDAIMFYCRCFRKLKHDFPQVSFGFDVHAGQQDLFGDRDTNPEHYDICFDLAFPSCEWDTNSSRTKVEKCCAVELGIEPGAEDYTLPRRFSSPLVGVHFFSTCSRELCCPEPFARRLWEQISDAGLIPIDTHMRHDYAEPRNIPYTWERSRIYDAPATVPKLLGVLGSCAGFAGVISGNMWAALSVMERDKILILRTTFSVSRLTRLPMRELDATRRYDAGPVAEWIAVMKSDKKGIQS